MLPEIRGRVLRAWIAVVVIAASAVGGLAVYRLHGVFGAERGSSGGAGISEKIVSTNPKRVVYELFGSQDASGMISYLDENAQPVEALFTTLPWSLSITTTLPSVVANIMAQGDGPAIGCRIVVNDIVRDERLSRAHNASTFCLVKAA
ncbi:MmpS family transport accessory protein [Mycolicibacter minnesotensis]